MKKEAHLRERENADTEDISYRVLQVMSKQKENTLKVKEEEFKRKQIELEDYEKAILLQEEQNSRQERSVQYDELTAQRKREFEQMMLEIKRREEELSKREQSLKESESSLLLSKSSLQRIFEELKDKVENLVKRQIQETEVLKEQKAVECKGNANILQSRNHRQLQQWPQLLKV